MHKSKSSLSLSPFSSVPASQSLKLDVPLDIELVPGVFNGFFSGLVALHLPRVEGPIQFFHKICFHWICNGLGLCATYVHKCTCSSSFQAWSPYYISRGFGFRRPFSPLWILDSHSWDVSFTLTIRNSLLADCLYWIHSQLCYSLNSNLHVDEMKRKRGRKKGKKRKEVEGGGETAGGLFFLYMSSLRSPFATVVFVQQIYLRVLILSHFDMAKQAKLWILGPWGSLTAFACMHWSSYFHIGRRRKRRRRKIVHIVVPFITTFVCSTDWPSKQATKPVPPFNWARYGNLDPGLLAVPSSFSTTTTTTTGTTTIGFGDHIWWILHGLNSIYFFFPSQINATIFHNPDSRQLDLPLYYSWNHWKLYRRENKASRKREPALNEWTIGKSLSLSYC